MKESLYINLSRNYKYKNRVIKINNLKMYKIIVKMKKNKVIQNKETFYILINNIKIKIWEVNLTQESP